MIKKIATNCHLDHLHFHFEVSCNTLSTSQVSVEGFKSVSWPSYQSACYEGVDCTVLFKLWSFIHFRHLRSLLQLKETSAHLRIQQMDSRLLPQLQLPWPKVGQGVMSSEQWLTSYGTLLQLKSFTRYVWNSDCSKSYDCAFCIVMAHHVKLTRSCIQKNYSVQCTLNVMLSYYDKPH